jgi:hypothetical protein
VTGTAFCRDTKTFAKQIAVFEGGYARGWDMFLGPDPALTAPGKVILQFLACSLR